LSDGIDDHKVVAQAVHFGELHILLRLPLVKSSRNDPLIYCVFR